MDVHQSSILTHLKNSLFSILLFDSSLSFQRLLLQTYETLSVMFKNLIIDSAYVCFYFPWKFSPRYCRTWFESNTESSLRSVYQVQKRLMT